MSSPAKSKEIQVQRPAQSLQAFQKGLEKGPGGQLTFLKPVLVTTGVVLLAALGFFGYRNWSASAVEK
ncbi:MAG TPA: hypothetical protein VN436_02480, partial [Holophaga sp.]|nr:hypothetical protein [Holophaga sp.]